MQKFWARGQTQVPVWGFRLLLLSALIFLFIIFSAADNGYCTMAVKTEVLKGEGLGCFEYWLNRYQALIGAVLALCGAAFAYFAVQEQISQAERMEQNRRQRDRNASRAVVPHALSSIGEYCRNVIQILKEAREAPHGAGERPQLYLPNFPTDVIPILQEAVRHSDENYAARFSDLIATSQIQLSRSTGFIQNFNDPKYLMAVETECENNIFDAADLFTRAMELFTYAREQQDDLLIDGKTILKNTFALGLIGASEAFLWRVDRRNKAIEIRDNGEQSDTPGIRS